MKYDIFGRPQFMLDANAQKRNSPSWIIELLIFALVFMIASTAQSLVLVIPECVWVLTGERMEFLMDMAMSGKIDIQAIFEMVSKLPQWLILLTLYSTAIVILFVCLFCKKIEKRSLYTLGFTKKNGLREYGLGAAIGLAMFAAAYGITAAFGGVKALGLSITAQGVPMVLMMLLAFLIQGASEEILLRGYLMVSLTKRNSILLSIAASSVVFGVLHMTNLGFSWLAFINIVLMGAFYAIYMVKRGNIWGACAIHGIWNFVQGNFFGLPVSGINAGSSVLQSEFTSTKQLITGGAFGVEASLPVTIVILIAIAVVCSLKGRDVPDNSQPPQAGE